MAEQPKTHASYQAAAPDNGDISSNEQAIAALHEVARENDIWPDHDTDRSAMLLAAVIKFLQK